MNAHLPRITLALLLAVALAACDQGIPDPESNVITGTIKNTTGRPVAGAVVGFLAATGPVGEATTAQDGTYRIETAARGVFAFSIEAEGYTRHNEQINIQGGTTIDRTLQGPNQVSGQVVNSQNGQGVPGALVGFILPGHSDDDPHLVVMADATGSFHIADAPDGTFRMCIRKEGFVELCRNNVQITGGTFSLDVIPLTPEGSAQPIRIELTWGISPPDLDAHLTGPDGADGRFHLFYATTAVPGATLDVSDSNGFGPEVITIHTPIDGIYRYSVHNFNDQSPSGAEGIWVSPALVVVYQNNIPIYSFGVRDAPQPTATSGNTWRVFEMTVSGGELTFNDNDGASLGYFLAAHPGDTGVFLTGGGDRPAAKASH